MNIHPTITPETDTPWARADRIASAASADALDASDTHGPGSDIGVAAAAVHADAAGRRFVDLTASLDALRVAARDAHDDRLSTRADVLRTATTMLLDEIAAETDQ